LRLAYDPKAFLKRLRIAFGGLSIEEIATKLGLRKQALYKWGRGETQPDLERLLQISEQTGYSIDWLANGKGQPNPLIHKSEVEVEVDRINQEISGLKIIQKYLTESLTEIAAKKKLLTAKASESHQSKQKP
jgi:transcriptional regulator with XRE-family HTH domain